MEHCPICNGMTAQKDLYTGELVCYSAKCYEGALAATREEIRETKLRLEYHNYRLRTQVEIAELREEIFKLKEDLERSKRG